MLYNELPIFEDSTRTMNSGFRRLSVALGRVLIGAMLFAQLVNAGQACIMPPSPLMAFVNADHDGECAKRVNLNSCLQQSIATDQSVGHAELPVLGMPDVAVLTLPRSLVATTSYIVAAVVLHRSTDPPPSIRFCSFQL
jgi:hypothetical protein